MLGLKLNHVSKRGPRTWHGKCSRKPYGGNTYKIGIMANRRVILIGIMFVIFLGPALFVTRLLWPRFMLELQCRHMRLMLSLVTSNSTVLIACSVKHRRKRLSSSLMLMGVRKTLASDRFPAQRASNWENGFMSWHFHGSATPRGAGG